MSAPGRLIGRLLRQDRPGPKRSVIGGHGLDAGLRAIRLLEIERRHGLRPSVFEDNEIGLLQPAHHRTRLVADDDVHENQLRVRAEDRLQRSCNEHHRQSGLHHQNRTRESARGVSRAPR